MVTGVTARSMSTHSRSTGSSSPELYHAPEFSTTLSTKSLFDPMFGAYARAHRHKPRRPLAWVTLQSRDGHAFQEPSGARRHKQQWSLP